MKPLFLLEWTRLWKQKSTYILYGLIFLIGVGNVFIAQATVFESWDGTLIRTFTTRTILETTFQLGQFQLLLIGVLTSLFIARDMSQGTIRQKVIAGYSKFEVYVVQMLMSALMTVMGLFSFHLAPLLAIPLITFPIGVDDGASFLNFVYTMAFGYGLTIIGVWITSFIALRSKSTAAAIIFTLLIFVLGPTLTVLSNTIFQALAVMNLDQFSDFEQFEAARSRINAVYEWVYFYQIQRLNGPVALFDFFGGETGLNFFHPNNHPYIVKTLLSNGFLVFLLFFVGGRSFAKSDLR